MEKALGLYKIPIEAWKCLAEPTKQWLATLFNVILRTTKMSDE